MREKEKKYKSETNYNYSKNVCKGGYCMQTKYDKPVIQTIMLETDCIRTSNPTFSGLQNGGDYDLDNPKDTSGWGGLIGKQ